MATVTRPEVELDVAPAEVVSLEVSAGKLRLGIVLKDGDDKILEQKVHVIPTTGAVIDQDGVEVYTSAPGTIATKLADLITAINTYVDTAATDEKL